jgi:hypothetical protein
VAAVWVESSDLRKHFERSVILFGKDNTRYRIYPYYGCYDPLSYPLFFPRGEVGWHPEIPKVGVSMDEVLLEFIDKVKVIPLNWLKIYSSLFSSPVLLLTRFCC